MRAIYLSSTELAAALKRAADAHHEYEQQTGKADADWPQWYAEFMAREQRTRRSDAPVWD